MNNKDTKLQSNSSSNTCKYLTTGTLGASSVGLIVGGIAVTAAGPLVLGVVVFGVAVSTFAFWGK
jgi:hypothetical protein